MGTADSDRSLQAHAFARRQFLLSNVPPIHLATRERKVSVLEMSSRISIKVVIHEPTANQSAKLQLRKQRCFTTAATVFTVSMRNLFGVPEQRTVGSHLREV